ncbi:MAG: hypothetical protein ABIV47_17745, partial [Roseiflexaceae bacterium]
MGKRHDQPYLFVHLTSKSHSRLGREAAIQPNLPDSTDRQNKKPDAAVADPNAPVTILVFEPGQDPWFGGWVAARAETIARSRSALIDYRARFDNHAKGSATVRWPWRFNRSTATGLPAYMRGWLDSLTADPAHVIPHAIAWLDSPDTANVLFGRSNWRELFPTDPAATSSALMIDGSGFRDPKADTAPDAHTQTPRQAVAISRFHVRFQQRHKAWPVFGGQISIHLTRGDNRVSTTSTYLPIPDQLDFGDPIGLAVAQGIARRALAHYIAGTGVRALKLEQLDIEPVPYAGNPVDEPAILPFAGEYRRAYEFHLTHADLAEGWSVFVDADTGSVLGRPASWVFEAGTFASSHDALQQVVQPTNQPLNQNPCRDFMDIQISGQAAPVDWPTLDAASSSAANPAFAVASVAIHGREIFDHMLTIGAATAALTVSPLLTALVGVTTSGNTLTSTYFAPFTQQIKFQHDAGNGLLAQDTNHNTLIPSTLPVHQPAHDPEVVYHEVAHGLMWRLNCEPFGQYQQFGQAPFARAMLEGYANYFARSLGAGPAQPAPALWAEAAYRKRDWQQRWAFDRPEHTAGEDFLPLPNLFPLGSVALEQIDLVYRAGMIWARALWDARALLGRQNADTFALDAFKKAAGWIISFEVLAEGMIEAADHAVPDLA